MALQAESQENGSRSSNQQPEAPRPAGVEDLPGAMARCSRHTETTAVRVSPPLLRCRQLHVPAAASGDIDTRQEHRG